MMKFKLEESHFWNSQLRFLAGKTGKKHKKYKALQVGSTTYPSRKYFCEKYNLNLEKFYRAISKQKGVDNAIKYLNRKGVITDEQYQRLYA